MPGLLPGGVADVRVRPQPERKHRAGAEQGGIAAAIPHRGGIPIGIIEDDASGNPILGFDETDDTTSIYAVRFGPAEYASGLQCGPLEVIDMGMVQSWRQIDIEWIVSFAIFNGKSAARLSGITKGNY